MNILPKKSWHVLSRDNIQRVRRDEAEAKAKEEEKQRRAEIAEREAKLDLMRKRARERDGYSDNEDEGGASGRRKQAKAAGPSSPDHTEGGHINFFADIKQGVGLQTTNVDHDKEKKEEQEKYEKRIGLLNYLVDKDKSDDPWYSKSKKGEESAKSKRRKELMDPLNDMRRFVSQTKKLSEAGHSTGARASRVPLMATTPPGASTTSLSHSASRHSVVEHSSVDGKERRKTEDGKRHKEHKSKSKHKKREKEREKETKLEEMRRQRRKREEAERAKAETMLRLHHGQSERGAGGGNGGVSQEVEDSTGRYNSQFNPHLVRQRYH